MADKTEIALNKYFCPNCHMGRLGSHVDPEHDKWNKCRFCGFMELKTQTIQRISCKLDSDCSCSCKTICERSIPMNSKSKDIDQQNPNNDNKSSAYTDQDYQKPIP